MNQKGRELALLGLRLTIAFIFAYHSLDKLLNPETATGLFSSIGLPEFSITLIGIIELSAGTLLILGLWHNFANYLLAAIMAGALILVHIPRLAQNGLTPVFERDMLIFATVLVLALIGPGHYSIIKRKTK